MNKKYFNIYLQKKQYNKTKKNNVDHEGYKNISILFKFITYICSY